MSHSDGTPQGSDVQAAEAVVRHHAQLSESLAAHTGRVLDAAEQADLPRLRRARDELLGWLRADLLPHARAEEDTLYRAAAVQPGGRLLVEGMLDEHRAITTLIQRISDATTPVRMAAAAYAVEVLFRSHLGKENDLVLPLLVRAEDVSVATLLAGMHELIGEAAHH